MSIALTWCDFKGYCDTIGPDRGRPPRPAQCVFCDGEHVWFNGWRRVLFQSFLFFENSHRQAF